MDNILNTVRNKHNTLLAIFLFALCSATIVYLFPREARFKYEFEENKTWHHDDLRAPFDFAIRKSDEEFESSRENLIANIAPVYEMNKDVEGLNRRKLREEISRRWEDSRQGSVSGVRSVLRGGRRDSINLSKHWKEAEEVLNKIYRIGVLDLSSASEIGSKEKITLTEDHVAKEVSKSDLFTLESARKYLETEVRFPAGIDRDFLLGIIRECIQHNVFYNSHKTDILLEESEAQLSEFAGMVKEGEWVVRRGDLINAEKFMELISLKQAYEKQLGGEESLLIVLLGQSLLVVLCMMAMALFLTMYYPAALALPSRVLFLLVLTLLVTVMAKFALEVEILHIYLAPVCILPIILRAFYDGRMALFMHVVVVFIVSFITPNPFEFVFLQVFAGILLLYGIRNLRSRSQFFNSAFVIFGSYSLTYFGLNMLQEGSFSGINWTNYAWFGGNALLSLMAYPLIYLFEKSFGFLSEVSLMEMTDPNIPLLRELNEKAPGTFQHSLQVANLAEEAIRAIGGDALRVRAGALYHDIGKMIQPEYFIENQQSGLNPHDQLIPEESSEIIINHVIAGIELARKHNIPDAIIDFIRTHHGTTRTEYFYRLASESDPDVDPALFTYPGPTPFSKETAVLMMADAVEAASRSIKNVSHEKLEQLVNNIIDYQIQAHQFSNSNVTFRNIEEVKKIFLKKLTNIYHVRVEYPEKKA